MKVYYRQGGSRGSQVSSVDHVYYAVSVSEGLFPLVEDYVRTHAIQSDPFTHFEGLYITAVEISVSILKYMSNKY